MYNIIITGCIVILCLFFGATIINLIEKLKLKTMAILSLKGFLTAVLPVEEYGENKTKIQKAYFKVPGYTDEFGEKKSNDEIWELKVIGDNVAKIGLQVGDYDNKKAAVKLFINAREFYAKDDTLKKKPIYSLESVLSSIEFL